VPVLLRIRGYRFFFYRLGDREPPHIHIAQAERYAKGWLDPVNVTSCSWLTHACSRPAAKNSGGRLMPDPICGAPPLGLDLTQAPSGSTSSRAAAYLARR
jgi:hypothetical protein